MNISKKYTILFEYLKKQEYNSMVVREVGGIMDKYIQQLIRLDEETKNKIQQVEAKKSHIEKKIKQDKEVLKEQLLEEAKLEVSKKRASVKNSIAKNEANLPLLVKKGEEEILMHYKENKEMWLEQLFTRCLD